MIALQRRSILRHEIAALVFLAAVASACATAHHHDVRVELPIPPEEVLPFGRVLVAGFVATGTDQFDPNEETARFLRTELRSNAPLAVIENQPLALEGVEIFGNRAFWKLLGEEYSGPLIVTGRVGFQAIGPRFEERQLGPRIVRIWLRGVRLELQLIVIDGETGEIIETRPLPSSTAYAKHGRESELTLYYQLMHRLMPAVLSALGQADRMRVLLR